MTSGNAGQLHVRSRGAPPGSSGDHADHPHVSGQFGRPRATSTPHNWHNFLRCHEQHAECRHPVAMARFEALPRRARTPRSRSREPQERILATPPAHRRETIVGPIWTSPRSSTCGCAGRSSPPSGDPPSTSGCGYVRRRVVGSGHARQRAGARGQRPRTMSRSSLPRRF
jgi:hypothetical protein